MKCKYTNVNSFAFPMIKTPLQIVEAFQEPYYSHNTSLISTCTPSLTQLTVSTTWLAPFETTNKYVLQYSTCLHSIKYLIKKYMWK